MSNEAKNNDVLQMAGAGAQGFGAMYAALGARNQSIATRDAYNVQSAVAGNNAIIDEYRAQDAIQRSHREAQKVKGQAAQLKGTQVSSFAARGLALDEGSPLSILSDTGFMAERDALLALDNGNKEAWGMRTSAANNRSNAAMLADRANAESPNAAFAGTLLTGVGKVASSWYKGANSYA